MLTDKTIVLGVTGSISAYKAAYLASRLTQSGARVEVVMTASAKEFITPLTFRALTGRKPADMFDAAGDYAVAHIALADAADIIVIAPATANVIAKLAQGIADDTLTATVLATQAPVIIALAMHTSMFRNPATQDNLAKLKARGFIIVAPGEGKLACGDEGEGRLAETSDILNAITEVLEIRADLKDKSIIVTAGGTREPLDPVRFIGNRSSGKMGYAIATAARDRGAQVTLITAPTTIPEPKGMTVVRVDTAAEMKEAVTKATAGADALIMAAAVADYRPEKTAKNKIKKDAPNLSLELTRTADILGEVGGDFIRVGFAAESENLVANARKKLEQKQLDFIIANDITEARSGFDAETNEVTVIGRDGIAEALPLMSKIEVAGRILDKLSELLGRKA